MDQSWKNMNVKLMMMMIKNGIFSIFLISTLSAFDTIVSDRDQSIHQDNFFIFARGITSICWYSLANILLSIQYPCLSHKISSSYDHKISSVYDHNYVTKPLSCFNMLDNNIIIIK